ncbi:MULTISPECIES: TetR/AcrR family transcriptional regulator [Anoxybacillus]|uniref:TetR/AcrR family transcriptional regulator n=1 Tax=Anoxybacillus flavithermus TaxID=33934 RepID=A0A178TGP0_9BACL|nr:TetR/AcrR family transcriptional regulator [Anoxybacillus flavithermus]ASA96668.1 TetR/AcrR family transcriptional regulator [Anoxybacillus flavithermus]ELK21175.1 transcriptional regulator, TetR family [Anoxybacillus flavithermus TNO-09.006]MBE2905585.1 TetR/AcrR family transcriptional regulator [Anoxybacillus flavithermus]MBE2907317.1 TetR/AcrR family transcriptional regulator [Anoxybacillus flavithermus]MBE2909855.1 TetR/AcrR family transcriptional regulator [Anoxybacillus flavithermus]
MSDKRKQIIEAAAKSFSLFGYKATTIDQVAKMANVGKGTIYTFFKSKEELLEDIVSSIISEIKREADAAIDHRLSFNENVQRALQRIFTFRKEHELTIKLLQEVRDIGTPAVRDVMKRLDREMIAYVREKIEEAMAKGEIRSCDAELTAFLMFKMYIALNVDWEKEHEPLPQQKIAELFDLYLLKGLFPR